MAKHSVSHAKQHENAVKEPATRKLLTELIAEWGELNLVERGDCLKELTENRGCTIRGLAKALNVDPGIIRRDICIAELPAQQRARIAKGASAAHFLRRQRDVHEHAKDDLCRQPGTKNSRMSTIGNLAHGYRPKRGTENTALRLQHRIEALEERISTLATLQVRMFDLLNGLLGVVREVVQAIPVRNPDGRITTLWYQQNVKSQPNSSPGARAQVIT
jgi:hypothetical protein